MQSYKPHDYQEYATNFILSHPACGLLLDMGLGKTVITLTALWSLLLDYFDVGLTHKDQKRLVRILRNLKSEGIAIIVLSKNLVFLDQIVNSIIVVKNNELVYNGKMSLLISEHIKLVDEPEILRFISLANKRGANLDLTLDSKELLKDIYRSVY